MEVAKSAEVDKVLVVIRWRDRADFYAWVQSEEFCTPSALAVPRLTVTVVR